MKLAARAADVLRSPAPADYLLYFRRFLVWHVVFQIAFKQEIQPLLRRVLGVDAPTIVPCLLAVLALTIFSAWRATRRQGYLAGLLGILVVKTLTCIGKFPVTANHAYLETFIVLVLACFPSDDAPRDAHGERPDPVGGLARNVICFATCSVWIAAGLRKVVQGYWLDGEFVAYFLHALALRPRGLDFEAYPRAFASYPLALPTWAPAVLIATAWSVIAGEILVPLAVAWPRTRTVGLWLFVAMAIVIGIVSFRIDFFFTNIMLIALFAPPGWLRRHWRWWTVLNGVYAAISGALGWTH